MGSGVALQVKEKFPKAYEEYRKVFDTIPNPLGGCQIVKIKEGFYIANLFSQGTYKGVYKDLSEYLKDQNPPEIWNDPKTGKLRIRFTDYNAFERGLRKLYSDCLIQGIDSIAFPYMIGCFRGGGDWRVVEGIIRSVFEDSGVTIKIYSLQ